LKILRDQNFLTSARRISIYSRKGIFPYEYVDCVEKLKNTCLSPRESFYSSLTGDTVFESDYAHAERMAAILHSNLDEYNDLYLKTDILLLADILGVQKSSEL